MNEFKTKQIKSFEELEKKIKESGLNYDLNQIRKAYSFAEKIHKDHKRNTGEPWISHCTAVAGYVVELKLDTTAVICALIHDVLDFSAADINLIDDLFGTDVAFIVEGLSKIRSFSKNVGENSADEDFNELIFNSAEDIRVVLVRLCEKLHNLITVKTLDQAHQIHAAKKTLNIYAPLAEFLGLGALQRELEDRAFKILYPERYRVITTKIKEYLASRENIIQIFEKEFTELLGKYKVGFIDLQARKKGIYSTYKKIKRKYLKDSKDLENIEAAIEKLKDIYAARVIVETVEDCYVVLGLVHANYETLQEEFVDYIAKPKENGYRSIHTLFKFKDTILEVQIRTKEMHEFAEFGPASHIAYKLGKSKAEGYTWTKDLVRWKDEKSDYKIQVLKNNVFCFTPKGLVISIPKGGTPLDFAFRVHTDLGLHYRGALVNGKMVSMDHELVTGDIVEIITTKNINITRDWLKYIKSASNRSRARRAIKEKFGK